MSYNASRTARRRRKIRRRILEAVLPVVIALVLIGIIGFIAVKYTDVFDSFSYSGKTADLNEYFGITKEEQGSCAAVIKDCEVSGERITVNAGRLYIPYDQVISEYNDGFYYETATGELLYTNADGVYKAVPGDNFYTLDGSGIQAGYQICYKDGENLMVGLDYVRVFTNFEIRLFGGANDPYRVMVKKEWGSENVADVIKDNVAIRTGADKESDILKEMRRGNTVTVVDSSDEKWAKVMSEDLLTGYIEKKHLGSEYERTETPVTNVAATPVTMVADYSAPVVLAWHNVTTADVSVSSLKENEKLLSYINTISPTWFSLLDEEGTVESVAASSYVELCHSKGIKVWGLFSNLTHPEISTYAVLSDPQKRAYVIEQLLTYANQLKLDGINVDFESLSTETGEPYVQFIRELCLAGHKKDLVISVDNYVPKEYTMHYNRKVQGDFADYVVIMGYDEHTSASEEAGSVASLQFVLDGIDNTIADVPKEKVINALPLYTRMWTVDENEMVLDVQTLTLSKSLETVSAAGAAPVWDDNTAQNYAEWTSEGHKNKIWLEDEASLKAKLEVMKGREVGGVAVWQLAFANDDVLALVDQYYPLSSAPAAEEE